MIFASTLFASAVPFLILLLINLPLPVLDGRAESALNRHGRLCGAGDCFCIHSPAR